MKCGLCDGTGKRAGVKASDGHVFPERDCLRCSGRGYLSVDAARAWDSEMGQMDDDRAWSRRNDGYNGPLCR